MRKNNPRIARCLALYLECRQINHVHVELKKNRGKSVEHKIMPFVTGWSALPEPGGVLDQGVWTMAMFEIFRRAENEGVKENHL